MSSSPSTIYLVTGSNRGIGFSLVSHILASHPDAFVYAAARDPPKATALEELSNKYPGRISIVRYVAADAAGNADLAKVIKTKHGRVDTVVANAAIVRVSNTVLEATASDLEEQFTVNVVGPVLLFQALHALLKASASPRFVPISTAGASLGSPPITLPINIAVYGASKAALNYVTRKIHFENEWLIAFPLAPGAVATEQFQDAVAQDKAGIFHRFLEQAPPRAPDEAATLLVDLIDKATRETSGGAFIDVDGSRLPW
ncbi:hypothetical protein HYPSUDRAFT_192318 [Hypholoma sublateritium FD-334 SS-4]|uniref:Ketoreductase (KR) domain-containing protein n=1 Tax=Hypholoma sublateritium (strain FD-334 SS-4) TaxID=945553 RepID=A0A0D2NL97_HYPSF|nr:hypothetical protein HYPSUDRAFT_192318 [Hypholoma sublateritium FD-334 SS-4]